MADDTHPSTEPEKIKHVQRVRKGDVTHLYFRKGDYREGPLKSADGTDELRDEVAAILAKLNKAADAINKPRANTIAGALKVYNRSADFLSCARVTQSDYQDYIDEMTADIGDQLLTDLTRSYIVELRDAWAARGYRSANLRMQVLKNALYPVILDEDDKRITVDIFKKVEAVRRPKDMGEMHPIWTDAEVEAVIDDAIERGTPGLARAVALARYGGFRRGTVCAIPLFARIKDYDQHHELVKRLYWITEKRQVLCDMREDPKLTAVLDRTPNRSGTIAYNSDGEPWKERQLNQAIQRNLTRLAKKAKVRAGIDKDGNIFCPLTIHGLRHSRGVELARSGNSDARIQAQLAQSTPAAAVKYRRQAGTRDMADDAQDAIDNTRDLREARSKRAASQDE